MELTPHREGLIPDCTKMVVEAERKEDHGRFKCAFERSEQRWQRGGLASEELEICYVMSADHSPVNMKKDFLVRALPGEGRRG